MNTLKNNVRLIGNLGKNPEVKTFDGNRKFAKFSVATSESYKDQKGEKKTQTQWHNVIAWGKTAEIAEMYLKKGCEVVLEGKLMNRTYEDRNGTKHYVTEIQVHEIYLTNARA
jgi:single-strand DNA-binding protein